MEKLIVVIMGQNCEKFIGMCLESVKDADAIVYCDGGSIDKTEEKIELFCDDNATPQIDIIENEYNQEDKKMNGKQRNFYLDYIKKNYQGYWCLAIDADEVVEGLNKIKDIIQTAPKDSIYSPQMRHLIGNLGHEDATLPEHFVPHRLFYISDDLYYDEIEHPVLLSKNINKQVKVKGPIIWHLSHITEAFNVKKKYENHLKKSNTHSPEFLKQWYYWHLFGTYPTKQFNPVELPEAILKEFGIDKDELYFANRGVELKHFIDAVYWRDFFKLKGEWVLEVGCGKGPRVYALTQVGVEAYGREISKFAIDNKFSSNLEIEYGDVTKDIGGFLHKLVIAYDLLEHIEYNKLDKSIKNIMDRCSKYILISIPFKGTPNCDNDSTHIIKEDRDWWIKKFVDKGLKLIPTPEHFLYKEQILIFTKQ